MTTFEFIFSLFGLLLGLSLAEVLGGFARAAKRHGRQKLGLLTPMLSLFLSYDICTFWLTAWRVRDALTIHIGVLIVGLAITGLYYFAAVLVWPDEARPESEQGDWNDLDHWMLTHKRQVMLSVFGCNLMAFGAATLLAPQTFDYDVADRVVLSLYFGFLLATAFAPSRRSTLASLGVLLALYALDLFLNISGG
jgi:hypothetical protein